MSAYIEFFKSVLGNDLGKSAKYRSLKIFTKSVLYKEQDGRLKVVEPT